MEREKVAFSITELNWPQDSPAAKIDRIQRLVPDFGKGKFYLPARVVDKEGKDVQSARQREFAAKGKSYRILTPTRRRDHEGNVYGLNKIFMDEYLVYPFSRTDDFLDACSRLYDMDYLPPVIVDEKSLEPEEYCD